MSNAVAAALAMFADDDDEYQPPQAESPPPTEPRLRSSSHPKDDDFKATFKEFQCRRRDFLFALAGADLSPAALRVILAATMRADPEDEGRTYPGRAVLAEDTGCDEATVRKALREAERAGWLLPAAGARGWFINFKQGRLFTDPPPKRGRRNRPAGEAESPGRGGGIVRQREAESPPETVKINKEKNDDSKTGSPTASPYPIDLWIAKHGRRSDDHDE